MARHNLIVIGAGPAGLSAAVTAARLGLSVALLDEQGTPGGQIYRNIGNALRLEHGTNDVLGVDYWHGQELVASLSQSGVDYIPGASVWTVEKDPLSVGYMVGDKATLSTADDIIIATGAYERPMPIPGWTLPGVMTAGAAQIMMKSRGAIPKGRIALAGSGPLLLLVAHQLAQAGANIVAFLETTRTIDYIKAVPFLPMALGAPRLLAKGLALKAALRKFNVPHYTGVHDLKCSGSETFKSISFKSAHTTHEVIADKLLLHEGIVPNVQISRQVELDHSWNTAQRYWQPVLDEWGHSSADHIFVAGDGGSINGAKIAAAKGALAAIKIAREHNKIMHTELNALAHAHRRIISAEKRIRPLLNQLYQPAQSVIVPTDPETLVCRCEEVSVADINEAVQLGCDGPNQLKSHTRCGMGPCQGRMCGLTASELIAAHRKVSVEQVGYYRIRSPIKPISLGMLAALDMQESPSDKSDAF